MLTGTILTVIRDHLIAQLPLNPAQCQIRPTGTPAAETLDQCVTLRELGIACEGRTFLREEYHLEVAIWRRGEDLPDDRAEQAIYAVDPVSPNAPTMEAWEHEIIRHLHGNDPDIRQVLNQQFGPEGAYGERFQLPLFYIGRGPTERVTLKPQATTWYVRRLKFTGLSRVVT
ncbi:MAG: hypothetical protein WD045_16745 [Pirellulaceae bacterium]